MSKLISFVLFLVLFYFFFFFKDFYTERKNRKKSQTNEFEDCDKIVLDSNQLTVEENEYYNSATQRNEPISYLVYETDVEGKIRKFISDEIYISSEGLRIKLNKNIKVYLYINKSNPDLYNFDLKTLNY